MRDGLAVSWKNGITGGLSPPQLVFGRLHGLALSDDLRSNWSESDLVNRTVRTNAHHLLHVYYLSPCHGLELCQIVME